MPAIVIGRDEDDLKKYGEEGTIFLGKHLVGTGDDAHLTTPVLLDVLRPHVICLTGKRGTGKSFSLGVIAEEISKLPDKIKKNLCCLLVDTQGIFWTMKSPNEKELPLLNAWGTKPAGFKITVLIPEGQEKFYSEANVEFDSVFSFKPSELSIDDWLNVFGLDVNEPLGILLQQIMSKMKGEYGLDHIISRISEQKGFDNEKLALTNYFGAAKSWGIFGSAQAPEILVPGKITVLDVSLTPANVRALLVALAGRKLFSERTAARRKEEMAETEGMTTKRIPMCWILIDEAHNFLPNQGATASSEILSKIVREGRQPGITLVLATQRPNRLDPDALAQCDMIISHRLTAKEDIESLKAIMQTYLLFDISTYINELPKLKGVAIVLDDNSERLYKIRVRPRQSWHAGASPVAV
ncbi:MAG: AAA family ATPase [Candidatus Aenigmatarchaeota archaeon]